MVVDSRFPIMHTQLFLCGGTSLDLLKKGLDVDIVAIGGFFLFFS